MFLFICASGNPFFIYSGIGKWFSIICAIVIGRLCLKKHKQTSNSKLRKIVFATIILFVCQHLVLEMASLPGDMNFLFKIYAAFLMSSYMGERFRETYFRVMVFISAVSLFFFSVFSLTNVGIGIDFDRYHTILIYNTLKKSDEIRNCGMFWEPGAFQGFIMVAFLLYIDKLKELWMQNRRSVIILILAILSTFSTTGYVVFFSFVVLYFFTSYRSNLLFKVLSIVVIGFVFVPLIWNQDFIGEKITSQFENAQMVDESTVSWSRAGQMELDKINIARHPIIGNGHLLESRYGKFIGKEMTGGGNGFTSAINEMGILFIICYFILIFKNLRNYTSSQKIIFIIICVLLLNGEAFLNHMLFWCFLFIRFPNFYIDETNSCTINCI